MAIALRAKGYGASGASDAAYTRGRTIAARVLR
jgi:hypothetical protein